MVPVRTSVENDRPYLEFFGLFSYLRADYLRGIGLGFFGCRILGRNRGQGLHRVIIYELGVYVFVAPENRKARHFLGAVKPGARASGSPLFSLVKKFLFHFEA